MESHSISDLCRRLERWLVANLPGAIASLNPGATDQEIAEYEQAIGFELPEDVRGWYRWRNGQKRWPEESVFFGDEMLSLADSLDEWREWQSVAYMNDEIADSCSSTPAEAVRAAYSLPGWIPLAQSPAISNYMGIDLNPGPKGTVGQVITFGRDGEQKCVMGASFGDFLVFVVEEMEAGRIKAGVPSGSGDEAFPWTFHSAWVDSNPFFGLHELGAFDGRRFHLTESLKTPVT